MKVVSHEMGFVASVSERVLFGKLLVDGGTREVFQNAREPRLRRFLPTCLQRVTWAPEG